MGSTGGIQEYRCLDLHQIPGIEQMISFLVENKIFVVLQGHVLRSIVYETNAARTLPLRC